MINEKLEPVLYVDNRSIKITRFFEVAEYLTKNNLWHEVEDLLVTNELIGTRIVLDKHLGNAVKVVFARHALSGEKDFHDGHIVNATVRCGAWRTPPNRPGPPTPSIPDPADHDH